MIYAFTPMLAGPPPLVRGMGAVTTPAQVQAMIVQAAQAQGVPPALALAVASHESQFNPSATNVNPATATRSASTDWGVMQLNDSVVQQFGVADPLDPQQNINAGVSLLAQLLAKYNGNQQMALWAYAQGSGTVANSPGGPNTAAQNFINYVQTFDASSILSSLGVSSDTAPSLASAFGSSADQVNALVAGIDLTDPATLVVGLGAVLGLVWLFREA